MVEAAEAVLQLTDQRQRNELSADLAFRLALVRAIEVIGEAATRVTIETRESLSSIPWAPIMGMRNRLSHAYFAIDYDIVWRTAIDEIPKLLPLLREALNSRD